MLIVFSGLPGTGKTTLARALAQRRGAVILRIDVIEQAIRNAGVLAGDVGTAGYDVALGLAAASAVGVKPVQARAYIPLHHSWPIKFGDTVRSY